MKKLIKLSTIATAFILGGISLVACGVTKTNISSTNSTKETTVDTTTAQTTSASTTTVDTTTAAQTTSASTTTVETTSASTTTVDTTTTAQTTTSASTTTVDTTTTAATSSITSTDEIHDLTSSTTTITSPITSTDVTTTEDIEYLTYNELCYSSSGITSVNIKDNKIEDILYVSDDVYYYEPVYKDNKIISFRVYKYTAINEFYQELSFSLSLVSEYFDTYTGLHFSENEDGEITISDYLYNMTLDNKGHITKTVMPYDSDSNGNIYIGATTINVLGNKYTFSKIELNGTNSTSSKTIFEFNSKFNVKLESYKNGFLYNSLELTDEDGVIKGRFPYPNTIINQTTYDVYTIDNFTIELDDNNLVKSITTYLDTEALYSDTFTYNKDLLLDESNYNGRGVKTKTTYNESYLPASVELEICNKKYSIEITYNDNKLYETAKIYEEGYLYQERYNKIYNYFLRPIEKYNNVFQSSVKYEYITDYYGRVIEFRSCEVDDEIEYCTYEEETIYDGNDVTKYIRPSGEKTSYTLDKGHITKYVSYKLIDENIFLDSSYVASYMEEYTYNDDTLTSKIITNYTYDENNIVIEIYVTKTVYTDENCYEETKEQNTYTNGLITEKYVETNTYVDDVLTSTKKEVTNYTNSVITTRTIEENEYSNNELVSATNIEEGYTDGELSSVSKETDVKTTEEETYEIYSGKDYDSLVITKSIVTPFDKTKYQVITEYISGKVFAVYYYIYSTDTNEYIGYKSTTIQYSGGKKYIETGSSYDGSKWVTNYKIYYSYNSDDTIKVITCDSFTDGVKNNYHDYQYKYTYNESGLERIDITLNEYQDDVFVTSYYVSYDEIENKVLVKETSQLETVYATYSTIKIYEDSKVVKAENRITKDGVTELTVLEYTYDEDGNVLSLKRTIYEDASNTETYTTISFQFEYSDNVVSNVVVDFVTDEITYSEVKMESNYMVIEYSTYSETLYTEYYDNFTLVKKTEYKDYTNDLKEYTYYNILGISVLKSYNNTRYDFDCTKEEKYTYDEASRVTYSYIYIDDSDNEIKSKEENTYTYSDGNVTNVYYIEKYSYGELEYVKEGQEVKDSNGSIISGYYTYNDVKYIYDTKSSEYIIETTE